MSWPFAFAVKPKNRPRLSPSRLGRSGAGTASGAPALRAQAPPLLGPGLRTRAMARPTRSSALGLRPGPGRPAPCRCRPTLRSTLPSAPLELHSGKHAALPSSCQSTCFSFQGLTGQLPLSCPASHSVSFLLNFPLWTRHMARRAGKRAMSKDAVLSGGPPPRGPGSLKLARALGSAHDRPPLGARSSPSQTAGTTTSFLLLLLPDPWADRAVTKIKKRRSRPGPSK